MKIVGPKAGVWERFLPQVGSSNKGPGMVDPCPVCAGRADPVSGEFRARLVPPRKELVQRGQRQAQEGQGVSAIPKEER